MEQVGELSLIGVDGFDRVDNVLLEMVPWGYPKLVLGAVCSFLEPFCGRLSPKIDKVS